MAPISEARKRANDKYIEKLDEIKVRVPKGRKAELQAHAEQQGESLNGFIVRAIDETIERDNGTGGKGCLLYTSTGVGSGFVSLESTVPFLMRMTRSAMAVRAWLWVMTMTVRPVFRQVSCSSWRMVLPVL